MIATPEIGDVYGTHEPLEMDYAPRKIKVPEGGVKGREFVVQESQLDTNHHVNNGQYVQMAAEYLPEDFEIHQMRAEYKKSAVLGDVIYPGVKVSSDGVTVVLGDQNEKPYAVIEFR